MSYEYDASGIYNETVDNVLTSGKTSIMNYLEEETIDQLCMRGCMLLNEKEVY
jgi:20S proteasome alpha/beta subunit